MNSKLWKKHCMKFSKVKKILIKKSYMNLSQNLLRKKKESLDFSNQGKRVMKRVKKHVSFLNKFS